MAVSLQCVTRIRRRWVVSTLGATAMLFCLSPLPLTATNHPPFVFGPKDLVVGAGRDGKLDVRYTVTATQLAAGHTLCLDNRGALDQFYPVTSGWIRLNGAAVVRPNDFNPKVTRIRLNVSLQSINDLRVELSGKPGSGLTLWIEAGRNRTCDAPRANTPPVANAGDDRRVAVGTLVTVSGSRSTDADDDRLSFRWAFVGKPAGSNATINGDCDSTASFRADTAGPYELRLTVSDGKASDTDTVTIVAGSDNPPAPTNHPPVANAGVDQAVPVGAVAQLNGSASSDPDGDTLTFSWSLTTGPSGSLAALTGSPNAPTITPDLVGAYVITLAVADGRGGTASDAVTINATAIPNRAPSITSTPITAATLLTPYVYLVTASDLDADTLTYSLTNAPLGLTIDAATGGITWLPPGTGTLPVDVLVSDGRGGQATQSFAIAVGTSANRPPALAAIATRTIPLGVPYGLRASANDPDVGDTLTFALVSGPSGAAMATSGVLTWTPGPGQVGFHTLTARVQDAAGAADQDSFTIQVVDAPVAPKLDPITDGVVIAGQFFGRTISAWDPNVADSLTFSLISGPSGLAVTPGGGLSWLPTMGQVGLHTVKVQVLDSTGLGDAAQFAIAVDVPPAPQAPIARDDRYAVRRNGTLTVPASGVLGNDLDPGALPLTAQLGNAPAKGALSLATNGGFTYTPTAAAANSTTPVLALSYNVPGHAGSRTSPVVGDLDGDGVAEIVTMSAGVFAQRRLHAIRGTTGAVVFSVDVYQPLATPAIEVDLSTELALADLDGDGKLEILTINDAPNLRRTIVAFNHDGTYRWTSDDLVDGVQVTTSSGATKPVVADLNHDGIPEIVVSHMADGPLTAGIQQEGHVTAFDANGHRLWTGRSPGTGGVSPSTGNVAIADIDLDGDPDIVVSDDLFDHLGNLTWTVRISGIGIRDVVVANLDSDPFGEIISLDSFGQLTAREHTGALKWGPIQQPSLTGLGLISVGDVDGDGQSEILLAGDGIVIRDRNGAIVRTITLPAPFQGFGGTATVFDLNADGRPEIIYNAGTGPFDTAFKKGALYIFDGPTGAFLHVMESSRHGAGVGTDQVPVVADVNGDGSAEIVTVGWDDSVVVRVFAAASGQWAATRPIWNQSAYHVTNVETDGKIPAHELVNWLTPGLNNYRVNVPLPGARTSDVDEFTYTASNGALTSNVARVRIDILPPNTAPLIVSLAPGAAAPGIEYVYGVLAVDPDPGEVLTFSLPIAPAGMTVTSASGLLRWTPAAGSSGTVMVVVQVADTSGQTSSQEFVITIGAGVAVPGVAGLATADATNALAAAGLVAGTHTLSPSATVPAGLVISQDPAAGTLVAGGAAIALVVSSGPSPVAVPSVVGRLESDARQRLTTSGFAVNVTRVFSSVGAEDTVVSQSPAAGTLLVPGSVDFTVSVGSGLALRLQKSVATAGTTIPFTVGSYGLNYQAAPTPPVAFAITAAALPFVGTLPTVAGAVIQTSATTRGAFRLTVTDTSSGHIVTADFAVTYPREPAGPSMNETYANLTEAMGDIDDLIRQARVALLADDTPAMRTLLSQIVQRWRLVDVRQLRLATPFGLEQGFFPTTAELPTLGLTPTAGDLLAQQVLKDAAADLQAWIGGVRDPLTSMADLRALGRAFGTRAARLNGLSMSEWGVIKSQSAMTAIISDRLPQLYDALMTDLAVVVATGLEPDPEAGIVSGPSAPESTLAEQVVKLAVEFLVEQIMEHASQAFKSAKQFATDIMKQAAFGAAVVSAAHHFREFVHGQTLTAVVAGASLSFHVFEAGFSFIESEFDTDQSDNNVVITIGPDLMTAVQNLVDNIKNVWKYNQILDPTQPNDGKAKTANDLYKALQDLHGALTGLNTATGGVVSSIKNAFQPTGEGFKGCVFTTLPSCGQLFYPLGLNSVYDYTPPPGFQTFSGLPVPILFMIYNRTSGIVYIDTPVFLPTKK